MPTLKAWVSMTEVPETNRTSPVSKPVKKLELVSVARSVPPLKLMWPPPVPLASVNPRMARTPPFKFMVPVLVPSVASTTPAAVTVPPVIVSTPLPPALRPTKSSAADHEPLETVTVPGPLLPM